ncbi:hypothetical protein B0A55_07683 [Friedmanniomyces simplex]|uniref:Uncharacterized protein n=1 Tax=Friedmanniomyces simplex TaxID=329884 RepID=A0A4U0XAY8_9PEZI|nr:hypothetical protein B0A55_07683 [Friedmanniomyces simplex]
MAGDTNPPAPTTTATPNRTFSFSTVAVLVATMEKAGVKLNTKTYELMARLDGSRSASSFDHGFRKVKARARELVAAGAKGEGDGEGGSGGKVGMPGSGGKKAGGGAGGGKEKAKAVGSSGGRKRRIIDKDEAPDADDDEESEESPSKKSKVKAEPVGEDGRDDFASAEDVFDG